MRRSEKNQRVTEALRTAKQSSRGWMRSPCPFCFTVHGKRDRKASLGIQTLTGVYHCFRCGTSGTLEGYGDPEADTGPIDFSQPAGEAPGPTLLKPPADYWRLDSRVARTSESLAPAYAYLAQRGVSASTIKAAAIGACASGYWANRIILPVLTADGSGWLGWSGRVWQKDGGDVPYLYPREMVRGRYLYNHGALFEHTDEPLLVVEGVFDALYVGAAGVAVLGKPSGEQIEALMLSPRPVVWLLDGDAWEEAWALTARMRFDGKRTGFVRLPPKLDPDECPRDWISAEAVRALDAPL